MGRKTRYVLLLLALAVCLLFFFIRAGRQEKPVYDIGFSEEDVRSVTVTKMDSNTQKSTDGREDVALICSAFSDMRDFGDFHTLPEGGLVYFIAFYMKDGSVRKYTYVETNRSENVGFISYAGVRNKVSGCGLIEVFDQL